MTINGKEIGIAELMRDAKTIGINSCLRDVLEKMHDCKTNALVIVDESGTYAGMVNAVDVIKKLVPDYLHSNKIAAKFADEQMFKERAIKAKELSVSDLVEKDVPSLDINGNLIEAALLASGRGHGRLVVVDKDNKPIGLLTRTELRKLVGMYIGIDDA